MNLTKADHFSSKLLPLEAITAAHAINPRDDPAQIARFRPAAAAGNQQAMAGSKVHAGTLQMKIAAFGTSDPIGKRDSKIISIDSYPIGSMYGIYANIGGILMVNVTIYSIHESYGYVFQI